MKNQGLNFLCGLVALVAILSALVLMEVGDSKEEDAFSVLMSNGYAPLTLERCVTCCFPNKFDRWRWEFAAKRQGTTQTVHGTICAVPLTGDPHIEED